MILHLRKGMRVEMECIILASQSRKNVLHKFVIQGSFLEFQRDYISI